jgi:hypothetical protein
MTKSSHTKKSSSDRLAGTKVNRNVPGIDKLIEFAEELSAESGQVLLETVAGPAPKDGGESGVASTPQVQPVPAKRLFSAFQAGREAASQLSELTNLKLDSVSAVNKKDSGWQVVVNLIELARIPHSTDVLGAYEVQLDAEGNMQGYHRGARYLRDQIGEDS